MAPASFTKKKHNNIAVQALNKETTNSNKNTHIVCKRKIYMKQKMKAESSDHEGVAEFSLSVSSFGHMKILCTIDRNSLHL